MYFYNIMLFILNMYKIKKIEVVINIQVFEFLIHGFNDMITGKTRMQLNIFL